jgi:site-specific DNA-methyltransferase (adenine-specific)
MASTDIDVGLYQGDCLKLMPEHVEDKSVDLILADLPYCTTLNTWDNLIPMDSLWEQYKRVLKNTGTVLLFGNQPFTSMLVLSNPAWYKQCLVWAKGKCGSPGLAKVRPMQVTEDIVVFAPKRTVYNPIMTEGTPYSRKSKDEEGYVGRCNNHKYGLKPRKEFHNEGTRYPTNILRFSREWSAQQQVHPTQKPVALMEWLIKTYSNEGDVVLDNVMGSGPVGVAAVRTGRSYIGMEMDETYFNIAKGRVENEHKAIKTL